MTGLSRRQAALVAALLDADGRVLTYAELGDVVGSSGVNDHDVVRRYVQRLHRKGLWCVVIVPNRGCRLNEVPPDWTLDDVLAMLDAMRREDFEMPVLMWRKAS